MIQNNIQILNGKKILLISPESWGINFVSKHHYAQALSERDNIVFYLNPPSKKNNITKITPNLYVVDYISAYRGLGRLPANISGIFIHRELKKIESIMGAKADIIWNFDTSRFFNLTQLKNKLRIAHIVDWSEDFNREMLCQTSDLCLCTSNFLKASMEKSNSKTYNIGHGYNLSDYKLETTDKQEINDNFKIKVGYVGNLNLKYMDWDIINQIVYNNQPIRFFFIGPEGKSNISKQKSDNDIIKKVKAYNNAYFLGEKPAYKIPAYLNLFDILILVYKPNLYKKQLANPHKLLEYLGSGKVIVSSWTEEYKDRQDLIEMVDDNDSLLDKFQEVVEKLTFYNSIDKESRRKEYALENTYQKKIHFIDKLVCDLS